MERKQFKILINAPKNKVWDILWDKQTYPAWTAVFMEGSRVETDRWEKGSKVRFLGPDEEGMVSTVADNKPNEYMSFKHLGVVKKGVEDYDSEQSRQWSGSMENYSLKTVDGKTELTVDMDITENYLQYFSEVWPKALQKVKELAEAN